MPPKGMETCRWRSPEHRIRSTWIWGTMLGFPRTHRQCHLMLREICACMCVSMHKRFLLGCSRPHEEVGRASQKRGTERERRAKWNEKDALFAPFFCERKRHSTVSRAKRKMLWSPGAVFLLVCRAVLLDGEAWKSLPHTSFVPTCPYVDSDLSLHLCLRIFRG